MPVVSGKRELLARALGRPLLRPLSRVLGRPGLLGLTYHRVCDYDTLDDGVISASIDEFNWQLTFLKETVRILSGDEILALVRGELRLDEPAVCITFDDGYFDNLEAGRVLAHHGIPAIFFVTSGFVGTDLITDWDRIAYATKRSDAVRITVPAVGAKGPWDVELSPRDHAFRTLRDIWLSVPTETRPQLIASIEDAAGARAKDEPRTHVPFMTWDDVRALKELGHTIGAHSQSHPILTQLSIAEQTRELEACRDRIETEIGVVPRVMAYPNGNTWAFSSETKAAARSLGYAAAFSFYGGRNPARGFDAYDLRRVWVSPGESRDLFRARISFPQLLA